MERKEFIKKIGISAIGFPFFKNSVINHEETNSRLFQNKVVLITGATSGIGEKTAYAFAEEGAKVFFCGRRENLGVQVQNAIRSKGLEATYMKADVRKEQDVKNFVDACAATYGSIDIAINNAGIATKQSSPLADQPSEDFMDIMATNAFGVFYCMKYEIPYLLKNNAEGINGTRGIIINIASVSAHVGFAKISPYSTSKHAILGLTKSAQLDYGEKGIRINSISPGGVDTPMRRRAYEIQGYTGTHPAPMPNLSHRANTVEEMANVLMFLASDNASSIFGTDIDLTGGMLTGAFFAK